MITILTELIKALASFFSQEESQSPALLIIQGHGNADHSSFADTARRFWRFGL